jgi:hypothetical protein
MKFYEASFPDPLAVPPGYILQVAAKQHVISTHARDQVTHITKVLRKSGAHSRWALLKWCEILSTSVWINPKVVFPPGVITRLSYGGLLGKFLLKQKQRSNS